MFRLKLIKHEFITEQDIKDIIFIKSKQWDFDSYSQRKWILENIKETDLHLILTLDNKNIAYLNLIDIDLKVNNINKQGLGVGNVCAIEKRKGYGFELMKQAIDFIRGEGRIGLLFCKDPLVKFYKSLGWQLLKKNQYNDRLESNIMILNIDHSENVSIIYTDKFF